MLPIIIAIVAAGAVLLVFYGLAGGSSVDPVQARLSQLGSMQAKTLEEFGATLRDATDLDGLAEELTGVVRETVQPTHISFWLAPARGKESDE